MIVPARARGAAVGPAYERHSPAIVATTVAAASSKTLDSEERTARSSLTRKTRKRPAAFRFGLVATMRPHQCWASGLSRRCGREASRAVEATASRDLLCLSRGTARRFGPRPLKRGNRAPRPAIAFVSPRGVEHTIGLATIQWCGVAPDRIARGTSARSPKTSCVNLLWLADGGWLSSASRSARAGRPLGDSGAGHPLGGSEVGHWARLPWDGHCDVAL